MKAEKMICPYCGNKGLEEIFSPQTKKTVITKQERFRWVIEKYYCPHCYKKIKAKKIRGASPWIDLSKIHEPSEKNVPVKIIEKWAEALYTELHKEGDEKFNEYMEILRKL